MSFIRLSFQIGFDFPFVRVESAYKMGSYQFIALLSVILLHATFTDACCKGLVTNCDDGRPGNPCCGVGSCNIFCCNCDGGKSTSCYTCCLAASIKILVRQLVANRLRLPSGESFRLRTGSSKDVLSLCSRLCTRSSSLPSLLRHREARQF
jgi:hypothetical protein